VTLVFTLRFDSSVVPVWARAKAPDKMKSALAASTSLPEWNLIDTSPLRNRNTQQEKGTWDAMAASLEELAEDDEGKILSNRRIEG